MAVGTQTPVSDKVVFVLVTCSMDEGRTQMLKQVIKALNAEHNRNGIYDNFLIFDNASRYTSPLEQVNGPARLASSQSNLGYWGALLWSMQNIKSIFGREFDYIHPLESDLIVYKTERLNKAVNLLEAEADYDTVRTQEFEVAQKHRYFKGTKSWFVKTRSWVAPYNGVTEETVEITPIIGYPDIYHTNWHAKVPALHRFRALHESFEQLAGMDNFTEHDFMIKMHEREQKVALLNKGIYYSPLSIPQKGTVTGSYSDEEALAKNSYRPTRKDKIDLLDVDVKIRNLKDNS